MSMDPQMIQQLLASRLQQGPATATAGGGPGNPQMQSQTSPFNAAATMVQKLMLMKSLQNQQAGGGSPLQGMKANSMVPGTNAMIANDPQMQALQQSPQMDPALLQQLQMQQPVIPGQPPVDPSMMGPP